MKAMVIDGFGGPEVFRLADIDKPVPGRGDVLIEVRASSVNPVDWKMRNGFAQFLVPHFPAVLHPDCAGVIADVGDGVEGFAVGDEVYSFATGLVGKPGALAEFMVADAAMVAKKPAGLSFEEAASLPLVWVTACLVLLERTSAPEGASLLIQGGTGGVGFVAVQLAAHRLRLDVYATCGTDEKCRIAESLGARKAFNYAEVPVGDMVRDATGGRGFDVVFNTPGAATINASVEAAAFGGTILDINGAFPTAGNFQGKQLGFLSVFAGYPITHGFDQEKVGRFLSDLTGLVDAGKVRPLLDESRFTFADVGAAHAYQENGDPTGKVVLNAAW